MALIVTEVEPVTGYVFTLKVVLLLPPGTMTLLVSGLATNGLLLVNWTVIPSLGARPVSVIVPMEVFPAAMLVASRTTELGAGGFTVKVAVFVVPPPVAIMLTGVELETGLVVTVKVAVVLPPATVTLSGTVAASVILLYRDTTAPPLGAALLSFTVPVELLPPSTLAGLTVTEAGAWLVVASFKVMKP